MSILGIGKTCVFSAVKVRVTQKGVPLKNVRVIRRWEWNELKEESTTTDEDGNFEFSPVFESSVSRLIPIIELVIAQGLYVVGSDGEEVQIWSNSKREAEENAEFQGKPINMACEMTNEETFYRNLSSTMHTICTWEK